MLYANQPAEGSAGLSNDEIVRLAGTAGITGANFATCVREQKYANWVAIGYTVVGIAVTIFVVLRQPQRLADLDRVYVEDEQMSPPDAAAAFPVA